MKEEKFECLKYLDRTYEHRSSSLRIIKEVPSLDQIKM